MSKFKKLVAVSLAATMAFFVGACNSDSSGEETEGGNNTGGEVSSEAIDFWYMGDGNEQIKPALDAFTEETGIDVNVQSIPWGSAHDRLLTAVASNEGPDVVQMGTTWMSEFSDAGALLDITDEVNGNEILDPDNYFEGNVKTAVFDGKSYAVPWYTETRVLYYRTDLLADVGYDEAPATWEELKDAADKLSERGDDYYGFNVDAADQSFHFMFARQNGAELLDENGQPNFTQDEFIESAKYLDSFIKDGASPAQDLGLDISQTFGGEGYVPMFISGPWQINIIEENAPDIDGKWDIATLPEGPSNNLSNTGGANLAIWNNSENVDEAIKLIEYLTGPEGALIYYDTTGSLPANKLAWEDERLQNDRVQVIREQLESSEHMPLIPAWEQVAQTYLDYWEQIAVGGADVEETVESFQAEAEEIMEQ